MPTYKILCIHGIGHTEDTANWDQPWQDVLNTAFAKKLHSDYKLEFSALAYDKIFENYPSNVLQDAEAVGELSGARHTTRRPTRSSPERLSPSKILNM
jgi:hypothetical protein